MTSVQTSVQQVTTTVIQTVTLDPLSFLLGTPTPTPLGPADLESRFRRAGTPATPSQIDAACNDIDNIVLNPNFTVVDNGTVPGWSVDATDDGTITVTSESNPTGNGTIAQFKSAVVGRTLSITQPLTLCPGAQYTLSSLDRQASEMAACTVTYTIGGEVIATIKPQEEWLSSSTFFTAKDGVDGATVDIQVTARCGGYGGLPVSDQEGWMRVEVSGISVVRDADGRRVKRGEAVAKEVARSGFGAFVWGA